MHINDKNCTKIITLNEVVVVKYAESILNLPNFTYSTENYICTGCVTTVK